MTPEFAKVIDPIFVEALETKERIESRKSLVICSDVETRINRKIQDAEYRLGKDSTEWKLAKYAVCAWIDAMLILAPWDGKVWWKDHPLEKEHFNSRDAHEVFFERASQAAKLPNKDALEVFYLTVVMGFRGVYDERESPYRADKLRELGMPSSVESWCREIGQQLQLRLGRPDIPERPLVARSPKPLRGRSTMTQYAMIGTILLSIAVGAALLVF